MATDTPPTSDPPVIQKKNNTKLFIIITVLAVILVCICSIVGLAMFLKSGSNTEDTDAFIGILQTYTDNADIIDAKWDAEGDLCDTGEEYNALFDAEYYEDEVDQLFIDVDDAVSREWACYKDLREYELELDNRQKTAIDKINCDNVQDSEQCTMFVSNFNLLIENEKAAIDLLEENYNNWKNDDICFLTSFKENFGNDVKQDEADAICTANAIDLTDELNAIEDEYDNLTGSLYDIAKEFLDSYNSAK